LEHLQIFRSLLSRFQQITGQDRATTSSILWIFLSNNPYLVSSIKSSILMEISSQSTEKSKLRLKIRNILLGTEDSSTSKGILDIWLSSLQWPFLNLQMNSSICGRTSSMSIPCDWNIMKFILNYLKIIFLSDEWI